MNKTILVTGGAGFIGSHVSKKLMELGYEVVIVDNLNDYYDPRLKNDRLKIFLKDFQFDFFQIDISNKEALAKIFKKYRFDFICHLAAQTGVRYSLVNPHAYEKSNILGTLNIFELAKDNAVKKVVFASSSSVYGGNKKLPFSESDSVDNPVSLYAATKKSNELMAYAYHNLYGIDMIGLRFFTVYGPWGRPDMAYYKFSDLICAGKPIDVYNNGKMKRDFTYIDDIVSGVISAIGSDLKFEIINLGNNQTVELEQMIDLVGENLNKNIKKNYLPLQPGDMIETWADINKAEKLLGYNPQTNIENGLKKFVNWYKEYKK